MEEMSSTTNSMPSCVAHPRARAGLVPSDSRAGRPRPNTRRGPTAAAVGPRRVLGLGLPERESDGQSLDLAREWATQLGIEFVVEDISSILDACRCYARRDAAIRRLVPEYGEGWRCKLVLEGGGLDSERLHVCYVAVQPPGGDVRNVRLPPR